MHLFLLVDIAFLLRKTFLFLVFLLVLVDYVLLALYPSDPENYPLFLKLPGVFQSLRVEEISFVP